MKFADHKDYDRLSSKRYALWWLKYRPLDAPDDAMRFVGGFTGITLYREGPFQTQLFMVAPGTPTPAHHHHNIDSIEFLLNGEFEFTTDRVEKTCGMLHINPDESHWAPGTHKGFSFLSFQKWLNGVEPSSVERDWVGAPIDEKHSAEILTS